MAMILPGLVATVAVFVAFNYLTVGTTLLVLYGCSTLGGYLLGKLFFNEKLSSTAIFSLLLTLCGLFLIFPASIEGGNLSF